MIKVKFESHRGEVITLSLKSMNAVGRVASQAWVKCFEVIES